MERQRLVFIGHAITPTDLGEGIVQAFHRADVKDETLTLRLHELEPGACYEVNDFDGGKAARSGRGVMAGFAITLKTKPGAAVLTF